MNDILLSISLSLLLFSPVYLLVYIIRKSDEREGDQELQRIAETAILEEEKAQERAKYHSVLYRALKALQMAGLGGYFITVALRSTELTREMALATLEYSKNDALRWADHSTPDAARHWHIVSTIFDRAMDELKGEGV